MLPFDPLWLILLVLPALFILVRVLRRRRFAAAKRDLLRLLAQADAPKSQGLKSGEVVRLARRTLGARRSAFLEDHLDDVAFDLAVDDLVRKRDYDDGERLSGAARGEHPRRWCYYFLTDDGFRAASSMTEG